MNTIIYFNIINNKQATNMAGENFCRICRFMGEDYQLLHVGIDARLWKSMDCKQKNENLTQECKTVKGQEKYDISTEHKKGKQRKTKMLYPRMLKQRVKKLHLQFIHQLHGMKLMHLDKVSLQIAQEPDVDCNMNRKSSQSQISDTIQQRFWDCLIQKINREIGEGNSCFCVYEEAVRDQLVDKQSYLPKEFSGYLEKEWAKRLLLYAVHSYFVILGDAPYVPQLLGELAPKMKAVEWILGTARRNEGQQYTEGEQTKQLKWTEQAGPLNQNRMIQEQELEDFAEDFYQEYGIPITIRFLTAEENYRNQYPKCPSPSNILDFTDEIRIPIGEVARGSIWLDMTSSEEKYRRFTKRDTGISYFSLKKQWKEARLP